MGQVRPPPNLTWAHKSVGPSTVSSSDLVPRRHPHRHLRRLAWLRHVSALHRVSFAGPARLNKPFLHFLSRNQSEKMSDK